MDQDTPSKEGRSVSRLLAPANSPALRNLMYACDRCRSKKIKCTLRRGDVGQIESVSTATTAGPRLNVLPCSKCEANNAECTYGRTRTERAIPKGFVLFLEQRSSSLIWFLNQVFPPNQSISESGLANLTVTEKIMKPATKTSAGHLQRNISNRFTFPPRDLCEQLLDIYFGHINIHWPLIHKPTLTKDFNSGRHLRDPDFACVLLGIFAVAGRQCTDSRVLAKILLPTGKMPDTSAHLNPPPWVDDNEDPNFCHKYPASSNAPQESAGWKYYKRIEAYLTASTSDITLCELQTAHLVHRFLLAHPDHRFGVLGTALRRAQALGLHEEYVKKSSTPSLHDELWKRAFWCLVASACAIGTQSDSSFLSSTDHLGIDLPLEIPDELWSAAPDPRNSRPIGTASSIIISTFNAFIKLSLIIARLYRSVKLMGNRSPQDQIQITNDYIRDLIVWKSQIPPDLHWDHITSESPMDIKIQSNHLHVSYSFAWLILQSAVANPMVPHGLNVLRVQSESLKTVRGALSGARSLRGLSCELCSAPHIAYMNDANFLIVLTTFVMFGLTREPSLESVDALLPELGDTIPILKNLCTEIVSDLKENYPLARHADDLISSLDTIHDAPGEEYTTGEEDYTATSLSPLSPLERGISHRNPHSYIGLSGSGNHEASAESTPFGDASSARTNLDQPSSERSNSQRSFRR